MRDMSGFPLPFVKFREVDSNGNPLAGGQLWSYVAGTSTPLATYTTQALDVANENPTILDVSGRASVFIPDGVGYKFILQDALGNELWSEDEISVPPVAPPPVPSVVPPGTIVMYGGTTAPAGWLLCDGASYPTTGAYANLFAAILGTFGGGSPSPAFNVPDLRQRFPLGKAVSGVGVVLGSTGGLIDHYHTTPRNHWAPAASAMSAKDGFLLLGSTAGGSTTVYTATDDIISGTANPPYLVLNFLIKM